jgi:glycosyltransferase involved in cell wall biosynthesis
MDETAVKKIAIICSTDYNTYPVGGMMSFIKDAAPLLAQHFRVDYWGVDAGGSAAEFISGGQRFPIRFFGTAKTGRKFVPNMVRVVWCLCRARDAVLSEGYDAVYIHGIPLNMALRGRHGPKRINHVHGLTNPFLMQGRSGLHVRAMAGAYAAYRKAVVRDSDLVLLAADHIGIESFRAENADARRIEKIENFCDTSLFGPAAKPIDLQHTDIDPASRVIVHVGRFAHQKDPLLALRAFAAFLNKHGDGKEVLVMIGDGPLLSQGRAVARELGLASAVRFLGNLERATIARWLAAADLYLYTSHANGYPISLAEAAQSGLPIVSTDVTGVHDLVVAGRNGALVHSREPAEFADAIAEGLANRDAYGQASLELAGQYTPQIVLARLALKISDVL